MVRKQLIPVFVVVSVLIFFIFSYDWKEGWRCYEIYRGMTKDMYTQTNTENFLQMCSKNLLFGVRKTRPDSSYDQFLLHNSGKPGKRHSTRTSPSMPPNPGQREWITLTLEQYVRKFGAKNTFGNVDIYCMTMGPEEQMVCF